MGARARRWLQAVVERTGTSAAEDLPGLAWLALRPLGCLGLEEGEDGLSAFLPQGLDRETVVDALAGWGLELSDMREVCDPGWVEAFHRSLAPLDVGRRFTILASAAGQPSAGRLALRFEPGRAFGTGHHESTRLAIEWLEDSLSPGERVLDVGTGTGILAAAAARLGAAEVLATDVDPEAIEVAEATLEALPERAVVRLSVADGTGPAEGGFDLVLANITADVLEPMLSSLVERLAPRGRLVLAGLLTSDRGRMEAALGRQGLRADWRSEGEWTSCRAVRP